MSAPLSEGDKFVCGCTKQFKTSATLRSHQRRHCRLNREDPDGGSDTQCPICGSQFGTYMGMRQHMRVAHAEEYNDRLQRESRTTRKNWTEDEENALARAEAEFTGSDIMEHLLTFTTRTRDAIKKRRQTPKYIEKVRQFKEEFRLREQQMAELLQQRNSPQHRRQQQQAELSDSLRQDGELVETLAGIPNDKLKGVDLDLRRKILTSEKQDVTEDFESWCGNLMSEYTSRRRKPEAGRKQISQAEVIRLKLRDDALSNRKKRALKFKLAKMEYERNKTAYARSLLDGRHLDTMTVTPSSEDIEQQYMEVFAAESPEDTEVIYDKRDQIFSVSFPITEEEVREGLKSSKANTPGPDGLTLDDARRIPVHRLLLLYNTILYLEYVPRCMKKSRTVLIPKTNEDLHLVKNWRPITISTILLRLCNKILAARLMKIDMCDRQRGFSRIDGCFANFATLETIIAHYRRNAKPISIISLDLAKAFDMVSHNSISRAVSRLTVDMKTRNIIADNYKDLETAISCSGNDVCVCPVRRGVKQGDPMSPILFNAVLDELLCQLDHTFTGVNIGTAKVTCLAYADDLILYANTPEDAQRMLDHCVNFFRKRGLKVNASKCRSISLQMVPGKKKLYVSTECSFKADGEDIPAVSIGDQFRYLGHMFNTEGITECTGQRFAEQLSIVRHAPLKPQQKYVIIRDHLIPRYIAVLQRPNVSKKVLQRIDRSIRSTLKQVLHLNQHCSNSLFYAPVRTGGLGIFEFSKMIPIISLSRWDRLKDWNELLSETYRLSEPWVNRYRKMVQSGVDSKEAVHRFQEEQLKNSFSGGGINQVKHHPACNDHIWRAPKFWSGEDFVRAIQLRYNLLPCQGIPSNPENQRRCRAQCFKTESLSHILQQCPLTHWWRIRRHDHVVRRLSIFATKRNWSVKVEQHVRCADGSLKKPDLIFEKGDKVIVTDVGINWEGEITLATQFHNKCSIYSTEGFVTKLKTIYPTKRIFILPLIVGARGAWCSANNNLIEHLELSRREVADIITTTIKGSIIIHREFNRCVWRRRDR